MARRVSSPDFVGRAEQVAALEGALARAERGEASAAFVAGDSGVGKTRLLRELEREIAGLARRARIALDPDAAVEAASDGAAIDALGLTERERAVLELVAEGRTNRQIGEALFMAEKTASVHVSRILAKLGVRSRVEAATAAHRLGLTAASAGSAPGDGRSR